jgi:hypothetical protein
VQEYHLAAARLAKPLFGRPVNHVGVVMISQTRQVFRQRKKISNSS